MTEAEATLLLSTTGGSLVLTSEADGLGVLIRKLVRRVFCFGASFLLFEEPARFFADDIFGESVPSGSNEDCFEGEDRGKPAFELGLSATSPGFSFLDLGFFTFFVENKSVGFPGSATFYSIVCYSNCFETA